MIIYSGSRLKATDSDGNTQAVGVIDIEQNSLKVGDDINRELLYNIIKELKILNYHMSIMTDISINYQDIETEMDEFFR